jgi:hypothetical protein
VIDILDVAALSHRERFVPRGGSIQLREWHCFELQAAFNRT